MKNVGAQPVLLVEGETLVGAWQNRTLNVSVLVGAGTKIPIPVSCVEAGRWGGAASMGRSGRHAPSDLRRLKTESVNESRRLGRPHRSDQSAVWDRVRAYGEAFDAALPTEALDDVYEVATPELDAMLVDLDPAPGQRGVVVAVGGVVRGIDCFDKESTLAAYWQGLVAGYAIDALQVPEGAPIGRGGGVVPRARARSRRRDDAGSRARARSCPDGQRHHRAHARVGRRDRPPRGLRHDGNRARTERPHD